MSGLDVRMLLVSGGDERLALDPATGVNQYGYGPQPAPADVALSSSTASTISHCAFEAVEHYAGQLARDIRSHGEADVYEHECGVIRTRLLGLIGCAEQSGVDIILSPSGTDLHLLAALLFQRAASPLLTLTLEPSETGSAVSTAASGSHFIAHPPSGIEVPRGARIATGIDNATIAIRNAEGALRDGSDVERELDKQITAAVETGHQCLLVVADVSKTGLIAPGLDAVFRLQARHGDRLDILVDACQLRLAPETIRAYLARGFPVAVTGSKFLGGPSFSGAMICPPGLAARFRSRDLPSGIANYSAAAEIPRGWSARRSLADRANLGLLLRWHAALYEWQALLRVPAARAASVAQIFAEAIDYRLRHDPSFMPIAARPIDRRALGGGPLVAADTVPTIFPFALRRSNQRGSGTTLLTAEQTRQVYEAVATACPLGRAIRLGQPIACGRSRSETFSALRLCLSARLIVEASASQDSLARLIANAMASLDRIALVSREFDKAPRSIAA